MYSINERFRQVFKKSDLSQDQFAKKIKRTRGEIANIIYDKVVPRKEIIEAVCEEFNVNRVWLETGVGEPFDPVSREDRIADILSQAIAGTSTARDRLIRALCRLPDDAFPIIEKYILEAAESLQDEKSE